MYRSILVLIGGRLILELWCSEDRSCKVEMMQKAKVAELWRSRLKVVQIAHRRQCESQSHELSSIQQPYGQILGNSFWTEVFGRSESFFLETDPQLVYSVHVLGFTASSRIKCQVLFNAGYFQEISALPS
jgi:hypothetical protein